MSNKGFFLPSSPFSSLYTFHHIGCCCEYIPFFFPSPFLFPYLLLIFFPLPSPEEKHVGKRENSFLSFSPFPLLGSAFLLVPLPLVEFAELKTKKASFFFPHSFFHFFFFGPPTSGRRLRWGLTFSFFFFFSLPLVFLTFFPSLSEQGVGGKILIFSPYRFPLPLNYMEKKFPLTFPPLLFFVFLPPPPYVSSWEGED